MSDLVRYEAARAALAEVVRIDEAKSIRDKMIAIEAYARQAKDFDMEADAVEIRERATRRLGELIAEKKRTGEISRGQPKKNCSESEQFSRVKLNDIGVDRKLSSEAQRRAALPEEDFERRMAVMRRRVAEGKTPDIAFRELDRERYRETSRSLAAGLSDAASLSPHGRLFPVIYADPPWRRKAGFGDRAYENHYPTMSWGDIAALPVAQRTLPDAWLFLWIPRAHLLARATRPWQTPDGVTLEIPCTLADKIASAWGFDAYSTCFVWTKTDEAFPDDHGSGLLVYDQDELLLLFKRGRGIAAPAPHEKFGSNHRERPREHSRKPDFYRDMISTMAGGLPVLELFARVDEKNPLPANFHAWGNQAAVEIDEPFDPSIGEIIESDAAPSDEGEGVSDPAASSPDEPLVMPAFLKRNPDNSLPEQA